MRRLRGHREADRVRRHDVILASAVAAWMVVAGFAFLAWASHRGFDPSMCEAHHTCEWREARTSTASS